MDNDRRGVRRSLIITAFEGKLERLVVRGEGKGARRRRGEQSENTRMRYCVAKGGSRGSERGQAFYRQTTSKP